MLLFMMGLHRPFLWRWEAFMGYDSQHLLTLLQTTS
jgi:hypothetical protein